MAGAEFQVCEMRRVVVTKAVLAAPSVSTNSTECAPKMEVVVDFYVSFKTNI